MLFNDIARNSLMARTFEKITEKNSAVPIGLLLLQLEFPVYRHSGCFFLYLLDHLPKSEKFEIRVVLVDKMHDP